VVEEGGQATMVASGSRPRTPGGIFLRLAKTRCSNQGQCVCAWGGVGWVGVKRCKSNQHYNCSGPCTFHSLWSVACVV
jgi:hypothetical protein